MQRIVMTTAALAGIGLASVAGAADGGPSAAQIAQVADTGKPADAGKPAEPKAWLDTLKLSAQLEAGVTFNPDDPSNRLNWGQLFTDKANQLLLNQLLLTAERPIDPASPDYDFGFKLQGMYGSDARYTHFLNEFDRIIKERNQIDIVEANVQAHLPLLTEGGLDVKLGQYVTPLGYEVIDAKGNPFYSHSYIFNFGLPLKHTGVLTTTHVTSMVDLYLGLDTGTNTSLGRKGDNNGSLAGIGGVGLNLMEGKLTILTLAHIGPEDPRGVAGIDANSDLRYFVDSVIAYKATDTLTLTTELNYVKDDGFGNAGYGAAQYVGYALSDIYTLNARAEVWRDDTTATGSFVAGFPGNLDFVNVERGFAAPSAIFGPRTTYGEITLGITIKPAVPEIIQGFMIRPEVRYDRSLNDTRPFADGTSKDQFTAAVDLVLPFAF